MYDAQNSSSEPVKAALIKNSKIKKIKANINSGAIDYKALFYYDDGSEAVIYKLGRSNPSCDEVREIPDSSVIVGMYGRC